MAEIRRGPEQRGLEDLEARRRAEWRALERRIAEAGPAEKGADFETWAQQNVFGDKRRVSIAPENNAHLARVDDAGLGLLKRRTSDHYAAQDGSLWDCKVYGAKSAVDMDQLRDYSLMERAGHVFDTQGQRIEVKSINYLFSTREAAQANAWRLYGLATPWYVDDTGAVQLLES